MPMCINITEEIITGERITASDGFKAMLSQKSLPCRGIAIIKRCTIEQTAIGKVLLNRGIQCSRTDTGSAISFLQ